MFNAALYPLHWCQATNDVVRVGPDVLFPLFFWGGACHVLRRVSQSSPIAQPKGKRYRFPMRSTHGEEDQKWGEEGLQHQFLRLTTLSNLAGGSGYFVAWLEWVSPPLQGINRFFCTHLVFGRDWKKLLY